VHIVAVSFSDRQSAISNLVGLWPKGFNTANYERVLFDAAFIRAFLVSVYRVVFGTLLNLVVIVLTAYPLAIREEFRGKESFKWFLVFAMLFSGGLIPWYLTLRTLGLLDNLLGLILPGAVQIFSILITINFFRGLPPDYAEAAEIDGASHWDILFRVYIPLSLPLMAAMTLFAAVTHWNSWFDGLVIMRDVAKYPLQTYLQTTVVMHSNASSATIDPEILMRYSERSWRAAQIVIASIPVLAIYPFLQRYFVTMRLGGIKG